MSLRLRYELHLERLLLHREYPERRLRMIGSRERRRFNRRNLFPNVERNGVGSVGFMGELSGFVRIRLQRELHVERKFVRCRHEKRRLHMTSGKRFLEYRFVNHADVERNGVGADRRRVPERNRKHYRMSVRLRFLIRLERKFVRSEMVNHGG